MNDLLQYQLTLCSISLQKACFKSGNVYYILIERNDSGRYSRDVKILK